MTLLFSWIQAYQIHYQVRKSTVYLNTIILRLTIYFSLKAMLVCNYNPLNLSVIHLYILWPPLLLLCKSCCSFCEHNKMDTTFLAVARITLSQVASGAMRGQCTATGSTLNLNLHVSMYSIIQKWRSSTSSLWILIYVINSYRHSWRTVSSRITSTRLKNCRHKLQQQWKASLKKH
jgi:hypothetical protein